MLILPEIPHKDGIILSQLGIQANHMNPLCIRNCRSKPCIINKEISLYKDDYTISFFLYGTVIWDPSGQPAYGLTHMGPMRNPVALPMWVLYG